MFSLDWMPVCCVLQVLQARCIAPIGRRGKSGTGDSKIQVGLFKLWCILFHCLAFLSRFKKICSTTHSAEAWQTVLFLYSENKHAGDGCELAGHLMCFVACDGFSVICSND